MKYVMDPEQLTSQACKDRAARKMADVAAINLYGDTPEYSVEMRRQYLAEAQVWATLATVPEPLEVQYATAELISAPEPQKIVLTNGSVDIPFPVLTCPHGYQARIDTIEAEGRPVQLRYSWADCPNPSCP